jgi:serine/threonine protein kinase
MSSASASANTQPFHPQIFGKFFLLQKIATGGMAEIFRAKSAGAGGFEKELALKRILPTLSSDRQFVRMLVNEAKLTVALTHPTIAQVYELGEVDDTYFIAMEFVDGASIHDCMWSSQKAGRPLTIEQSIYLCLEVLRGLDYAHKKTDGSGNPLGLVHCDVSPDNAMITWDGAVKLLDFGIARAAQGALSNYREGTLMGKLNYVAPEQANGEWFDLRVDLFAVGVMFYELITGKHPFGRVESVDELRASRKRPVIAPSKVKPGLPEELDAFVLKSLAAHRDDRFQSAKEMADELNDLLFPTAVHAVSEHLAATMKEIYRERIERQQRLRSGDALNIKVLLNVKARDSADVTPRGTPILPDPVEPPHPTRVLVSSIGTALTAEQMELDRDDPMRPRPRPAPGSYSRALQVDRGRTRRALLLGGALGLAVGLGVGFGWHALRGPTLVVLSAPAGAQVEIAGRALGTTPLVLENAPVPEAGEDMVLRLDRYRSAHVTLKGNVSPIVVQEYLKTAVGPVRVESDPAGATVRVDGNVVGETPVDVPDLKLDELHRFDLQREGFDLDSFIVKPDQSGPLVRRTLVPLSR